MRDNAIEKGIRLDIPYFEGVNGIVSHTLAKKTEFRHVENARSTETGSIEKRAGQSVMGDGTHAINNYRLMYFPNDTDHSLYRISSLGPNISVSVSDQAVMVENTYESFNGGSTTPTIPDMSIFCLDKISIQEGGNVNGRLLIPTAETSQILYYDETLDEWVELSDPDAQFQSGKGDHTIINGELYVVNKESENRYIENNGSSVITSADASGNLFNSPRARKISFYKNRIYLSNFIQNGIDYPSTVLRSSYPMGIIALVSEDTVNTLAANSTLDLAITDNKYFYTNIGAREYQIYRGNNLIGDIYVNTINETSVSIVVSSMAGSNTQFLSSDEIWIKGTFGGEKKYRWVNNSTAGGDNTKQYDTFQVTGGENDEIKMQIPIGDVLLFANNNSLSIWNDYTLQSFDINVGCVSHDGYVKSYGSVYFIHYTGIYVTNGGVPVLVSQKVQRYIDGATKSGLENAAAGKKGRSVFFQIGDVTLYKKNGSVEKTLRNVCLEYNIPENNWFVHTNFSVNQFETYRTETSFDTLAGMGTTGNKNVKKILVGNLDETDEIPFRVDLQEVPVQTSAFENIGNPISVIVESTRGSSMKCFISLDGDDFYELDGKIVRGASVIKIHNKDAARGKPPPARTISVSIRDASTQICKLNRISIISNPVLADSDDEQ